MAIFITKSQRIFIKLKKFSINFDHKKKYGYFLTNSIPLFAKGISRDYFLIEDGNDN